MYLRAVTECGFRRTVSLSYFHVRLIIGSKTSPSTVVKIHTSTGIVLNRVIQFKVISLQGRSQEETTTEANTRSVVRNQPYEIF